VREAAPFSVLHAAQRDMADPPTHPPNSLLYPSPQLRRDRLVTAKAASFRSSSGTKRSGTCGAGSPAAASCRSSSGTKRARSADASLCPPPSGPPPALTAAPPGPAASAACSSAETARSFQARIVTPGSEKVRPARQLAFPSADTGQTGSEIPTLTCQGLASSLAYARILRRF
jgi:hypothetical protein